MSPNLVDVYVDGSFDGQNASWAFAVIDPIKDSVIFEDKGVITDPDINSGRQIGGEVQAVIEAIECCKRNSLIAIIYYDYIGIEEWARCRWVANKSYTKRYQEYMMVNGQYFHRFVKIKSHTGNKWNEYVDKLAKSND